MTCGTPSGALDIFMDDLANCEGDQIDEQVLKGHHQLKSRRGKARRRVVGIGRRLVFPIVAPRNGAFNGNLRMRRKAQE
jgi:hypothetical protein